MNVSGLVEIYFDIELALIKSENLSLSARPYWFINCSKKKKILIMILTMKLITP